jgi:long-chain acyl-CoA synthetase
MTWRELGDRVRDIAAGLVASGVQTGDRVAVMSRTRIEWTIADLAILSAAAMTVPIYDTSAAEQCRFILSDAGAGMVLVDGAEAARTVETARDEARFGEVVVFDEGGLDEVALRGGEAERTEVRRRLGTLTGQDVATIVYTSGTTGTPKGCVLTHRNLLWTVRQTEQHLEGILGRGESTVLFLPLAHVFSRIIQLGCLDSDTELAYARGLDALPENLRSVAPTFLLAVPQVLQKVFNSARRQATGVKARIFDFAVSAAEEWSQDDTPGLVTEAKRAAADKVVYAKLREGLGGRVRFCISGGAPLSARLAHFFHAVGITVLEGYGLTETSAPVTVNRPQDVKIGTVGQPLPGVEVRIAGDGEILIRGENVFSGYRNNQAATRETFEDGWFRTGDIGRLDGDGFLRVTDRKKELIVPATGKNVTPSALEEGIKAHPLVSQAMVVGDGRPFIGALVTLDLDELHVLAAEHSLPWPPIPELYRHEVVRAAVQDAVDHANRAVSRPESVREFVILDREFTEQRGEVTPTMKLKRPVIEEEIESIYRAA